MPLDKDSPPGEIAAFAVDYVRREFESLRDGFARDGVTMLEVYAEPIPDRESWDLVIVLRRAGVDGDRQMRFDLDRRHGSASDRARSPATSCSGWVSGRPPASRRCGGRPSSLRPRSPALSARSRWRGTRG